MSFHCFTQAHRDKFFSEFLLTPPLGANKNPFSTCAIAFNAPHVISFWELLGACRWNGRSFRIGIRSLPKHLLYCYNDFFRLQIGIKFTWLRVVLNLNFTAPCNLSILSFQFHSGVNSLTQSPRLSYPCSPSQQTTWRSLFDDDYLNPKSSKMTYFLQTKKQFLWSLNLLLGLHEKLLLVFSVTPFKIDQNKNQNRSID